MAGGGDLRRHNLKRLDLEDLGLPVARASAGLQRSASQVSDRNFFPAVQLLNGAADLSVSADHDRTLNPAQTVARLRPHFQALGITRLGELTGLDQLGIPVAFASRPNSFSLSLTLGKGIDRDSAFASAAMEAAEAAIAERIPAGHVRASPDDMQRNGASVIDLTRIARCQPDRLEPDTPLDWVKGLDLMTGQPLWVPWGLAGLDHRLKPLEHHDAFEASTDGLASGNVAAEAVLHGIYELIERDAHALLELLPPDLLSERLCDPGQFESNVLSNIKQLIAEADLALHLLDMTTDISIPAFMAMLTASQDQAAIGSAPSHYSIGCGCHVSPQRAIIRALTEAAQARLALIAGARDDFRTQYYQPSDGIQKPLAWQNPPPSLKQFSSRPDSHLLERAPTIGQSIENVLAELMAVGVDQVIIVELECTVPGISVVRVIIPDLQIPLHGTRTQVTTRGLTQLLKFQQ